ncbi:DUF1214 domain-containing protein [Nocardia sp. NPDC048505]|uniref:DUF1214 domain-containing protein n=1 Tax=Nocardia sp. NPDC048505 TaxID=3155756 RepID=UPI0033FFB2DD
MTSLQATGSACVPRAVEEILYFTDREGLPLHGANLYVLSFDAFRTPHRPGGFWELSVCAPSGTVPADGPITLRLGTRSDRLRPSADGTLTVALSADRPRTPVANWLPVPDSPFTVMHRTYFPGSAVIDGTYRYPSLERT